MSARRLSLRDACVLAAAAYVAGCAFVLASACSFRSGFPLDDSWIHATYARNLALRGEWAFRPGELSAGSTAPLWTLLLTPGYALGLAPLYWSHFLSLTLLVGLGILAEITVRELVADYRPAVPWLGLAFALEWHMLWAALSGMETLAHSLLTTLVISLLLRQTRHYALLGLLTGLSVWFRPDGLTLIAPVLLAIAFGAPADSPRPRAILSYVLGLGALLLPYLALNLWLSGTPMPNTFYAKQAEYAAWQAKPLAQRLPVGLAQLVTGTFLAFVPGAILFAIRVWQKRDAARIAVLLWSLLFVLVYLVRLPPYQHGRYLMPAMPALLLIGVIGYMGAPGLRAPGRAAWVVGLAWRLASVMLTAGFLVLGARAYSQDVELIESEMVSTAEWISTEIGDEELVAAHDIGAIGYFDDHPLIDLAGLISPEVVPFIRDETRLAEYLDQRGATYLIAFPDLYPALAADSVPVHVSGGLIAPSMGQGNMTVYCWRCR